MTSNQDILSFLKADRETRAKEKEQEKQARSKEREEDMAKIAEMIKDGVRDEVKAAILPVEERLLVQEKASEGLGSQMMQLMGEMETLKGVVQVIQEFPALPQTSGEPGRALGGRGGTVAGDFATRVEEASRDDNRAFGQDVTNGDYRRVLDICSKARRIIGFTPIEPRMLDMQMKSYGAKTMEEAMLMEVQSYLKCEMKVRPSEVEKLEIVRIFPPAKENWDTLYVEFGNEYEVDKIFRHTRVMVKDDHKVVRWFPKEIFERFQSLDFISFNMREESKKKGVKLRTRVRVGKDDLEFSTKTDNGRWLHQPLPNGLPKIDLQARGRPSLTSSPPPGRPDRGEDDRKRQHSGSDAEEAAKKPKTAGVSKDGQQVDMVGDKQGSKEGDIVADKVGDMVGDRQVNMGRSMEPVRNEQGVLVTSQLDPGLFTNQEAYSPLTPAKSKNIPDLSIIVNSPVYHNKARNSQS